MKKFGIDISTWQAGYPYTQSVNEGVEFAILRAGYSIYKDSEFDNHYNALSQLGIPMGAYWYMYAQSVEQARNEAYAFLSVLNGKKFDYPIYLDLEDPSLRGLDRGTLDAMVIAFGDVIESAGYYFGVYTNIDWYNNVISGAELNQRYDWWIASWGTQEPTGLDYGVWQFGGSTNMLRSPQIAGVTTDQNYCYKDYPSIISGKGANVVQDVKSAISETFADINVGDKVQVKNAVQYNGEPFSVYFSTYDVIEVVGDRVVIGKGSTVTCAININNIVKVGSIPNMGSDIVVGGKVRLLQAIQYNGQPFTAWYDVYDVIEVVGDRVVIGINGVVTSAVNKVNVVAV